MNLFIAEDGRIRSGWRFVFSVVLWYLANIAAVDIADALTSTQRGLDALYRPLVVVFLLLAYSLLLKSFDRVRGNPLAHMGLGLGRGWVRESAAGLAMGAGMIVIAVGLVILLLTQRSGPAQVWWDFTGSGQMLRVVLLVLCTLAFGAMAEEVAFRGYPFQRLVESMGAVPAIVVSSALFGAVHLRNPNASVIGFVNTVLVGVLLSLAYLRTRRLWLPWGIHFAWNAMLGLVLGLPVSGITDFAVLARGQLVGPRWITGGDYGLEASAVTAVVIVLATLALLKWFPARALAATPGSAGETPDLSRPSWTSDASNQQ